MLTCIRNVNAVINGQTARTDLYFEDGIMKSSAKATPDAVIDGTGLLAIPGFIDTHIHGFGGQGTEDGTQEAILTMSRVLGIFVF